MPKISQEKRSQSVANVSGQPGTATTQAKISAKTIQATGISEQAPGKERDGKSSASEKPVAAASRSGDGLSGGASSGNQSTEIQTATGPVFFNSDFENGDLTNWTPVGEAFQYQPTKGDNPTARKRNQPSSHQGDFWIGSFEKYRGEPDEKPGSRQGDKPTGTLSSIPFEITGDRIGFLIGGGGKIEELSVVLIVEGREVRKATGQNTETMERIEKRGLNACRV